MIIRIKNLRARTIVGVYEWEKETKRDVLVNLQMEIDAPQAGSSDALEHTLDYDAVQAVILDYLEQANVNLIETLATHILERLSQFPLIRSATLEIDKPGALSQAESVSVVLSRTY